MPLYGYKGPRSTAPPAQGDWLTTREFDRRKSAHLCLRCTSSTHRAGDCRNDFVPGETPEQKSSWKKVFGPRGAAVDPDGVAGHARNMRDLVPHDPSEVWRRPYDFPDPVRDAGYGEDDTIVDEDRVIGFLKRKAPDDLPAPPAQRARPSTTHQRARPQDNTILRSSATHQAPVIKPASSPHPPTTTPATKAPEPAPKENVGATEARETVDLTSPGPAASVPAPKGKPAPPKWLTRLEARLSQLEAKMVLSEAENSQLREQMATKDAEVKELKEEVAAMKTEVKWLRNDYH